MKRLICTCLRAGFAVLLVYSGLMTSSAMATDGRQAGSAATEAATTPATANTSVAAAPEKAKPEKANAAAAAQSNPPVHAISLSPSVIMTRGLPGQSVTQTLTISNSTSMPFAFEMVAEDIVVRNGKREFINAGELPQSIAATAVFSKPTVVVQPGQSASVNVTVTLVRNTEIRAIAAIFHGTDKIQTERSAVGMTASLGCLITFTASENFAVTASEIAIKPQSETQPLRVTLDLSNAGTEPVIPEGVVALLSDAGKMVGKAPFPAHRLLPGERLEFAAEYGAQLRPGRYRAVTSFQFEDKTLLKTADFSIE